MANARQHPILHYLRQVLGAPANVGVADAELLRRFVHQRDEAAFELLLWRHAAMVLHVCRQVLRSAEAVEDAFQATFLVFVRKAGSISRRESLGGWLYRVAYRIALKARDQAKKRASTDLELDRIEAPADTDDAGQRELRRMIGEEVNRLPAKYRAPIVACFFEGKTHEEAAQQLGWPRGTVAGRLARARELLRRRLVRRGVTLTTTAFTAALAVQTAPAALTGLIQTTIQTAKLFVMAQSTNALLSPRIVALAEGVLKNMFLTKLKIVAIFLVALGLLGAGALAYRPLAREQAEVKKEDSPKSVRKATGKSKTDKERLQGTWLLVAEEYNGKPTEKEKLLPILWVIREDQLIAYKNQHEEMDGSYRLDPTKNPKTIAVKGVSHQGRDCSSESIYKLDSDTLTVATGKKARPQGFDAKKGDGVMVAVFKRQPPRSKAAKALKPDREKVQGTWIVAAEEIDGKRREKERAKAKQMIFEGDKVILKEKGQVMELSYGLDSDENPKVIDITDKKGRKLSKGIYKLDGDTLTIHFVKDRHQRPKDFDTKGKGSVVTILKRDPPRQSEDQPGK